jgi:hypothetical protein
MVDTLAIHPERFWYFNNGITILCEEISKKLTGGAERTSGVFECKAVSIVNGAQTVGSIAQAAAKNPEQVEQARVQVRFISLKDCPEGFATDVTRAANTQNRIEPRDFAALDPEQERLRIELSLDEKKMYVYKTGAFSVSPKEGCTVDDAAVALACAQPDVGLAVQAKREVSKLYEDINKPPYKLLFNASLSAVRLWRAVEIQRVVEETLRVSGAELDGRDRLVAVHGNRFILHHVFRRLPLDKFDIRDFDFDQLLSSVPEMTKAILQSLIKSADELFPGSYLNSLFKNSEKCRLLSTEIQKQPGPEQVSLGLTWPES